MRINTVLCATALATVAAFPLAGVAAAQSTDLDCRDFASQAAAQTVLRSRSGDAERLDADHDGWACEDHFKWTPTGPAPAAVVRAAARPDDEGPQRRDGDGPQRRDGDGPQRRDGDEHGDPEHGPVRTVPEHQILAKPHGPADTGDGSAAASDPAPAVLLVGGVGAVGAVGVAGALGARRRAARR
jgi:hypothetical protein